MAKEEKDNHMKQQDNLQLYHELRHELFSKSQDLNLKVWRQLEEFPLEVCNGNLSRLGVAIKQVDLALLEVAGLVEWQGKCLPQNLTKSS